MYIHIPLLINKHNHKEEGPTTNIFDKNDFKEKIVTI